jgi:uncharacterized membrane protein YsdA (DUF1294 family)
MLSFATATLAAFGFDAYPVPLPALVYAAMSIVTFVAYGVDKRRARQRHWRIPEATLHLLDAACGWPGGLAAQRFFRHKVRKTSFQISFWAIVVLHVAFWSWWLLPWR